jgi:hypothetical protein
MKDEDECPACNALKRTTFFGKPPKCPKHRNQKHYLGLGE